MKQIIGLNRSVIVACDVTLEKYEEILKETAAIPKIGAYKIGFGLGLSHGLPKIVELTRQYTEKPIIYDHQKAGTDIPDTGRDFARACSNAKVDAIILFPQAGPKTEEAWIKAAQESGLGVIVGGLMTHQGFTDADGGWIRRDKVLDIYRNAAEMGVRDFVVPGNKPGAILEIKTMLETAGVQPTFYAPGFVAQGGEISQAASVAGENWHAIVGRGIYAQGNLYEAAINHSKLI